MSERDVLDEAFDALREETQSSSSDNASRAAATRRRLLLALAMRRRRRTTALRFVLPLAAVLAAGTAWAALTGRLTELVSPRSTPQASSSSQNLGPVTAPRSSESEPQPQPEPEPEPSSMPSPAAPPPSPSSQPRASSSQAAPATSRPLSARAVNEEDSLYAAAHEAHFVARDPAAALDAWNAYLKAYPNGRFAPEARYNRALMLIRLGRTAEARSALRPFADAAPGSYRQAEARALLDATE